MNVTDKEILQLVRGLVEDAKREAEKEPNKIRTEASPARTSYHFTSATGIEVSIHSANIVITSGDTSTRITDSSIWYDIAGWSDVHASRNQENNKLKILDKLRGTSTTSSTD